MAATSMKKSVNLWAFPYPDKWTLAECLKLARDAGFDAVEWSTSSRSIGSRFSAGGSRTSISRSGISEPANSACGRSGRCSTGPQTGQLELEKIDCSGCLTFEYFHPFAHFPEALIYQASDAIDWMLGRKK